MSNIYPVLTQPRSQSSEFNELNETSQCPQSGLECLISIDELLVHQKAEYFACTRKTEFTIKNAQSEKLFWSIDDTDCCGRMCNGNDMKVFDNLENEVIHFHRPLLGCCSFLQSIEVSSPPGQVIGRVKQDCSFCYPQFSVKDHNGDVILRIEGPCGLCSCTGEMKFKIFSLDGEEIGKITKHWSGLAQEMFTVADNFSIKFPGDLSIQAKALLLGACILIILSIDGKGIGKITKQWSGFAQEFLTVDDNFNIKFPRNLSIQTKALLLGACILIDAMFFNGKQ